MKIVHYLWRVENRVLLDSLYSDQRMALFGNTSPFVCLSIQIETKNWSLYANHTEFAELFFVRLASSLLLFNSSQQCPDTSQTDSVSRITSWLEGLAGA